MLANFPLTWDLARTTPLVGTGTPQSRVVASSITEAVKETATTSRRSTSASQSATDRRRLPKFPHESILELIGNLIGHRSSMRTAVSWNPMRVMEIALVVVTIIAATTVFAQSSCTMARVETRTTSRITKSVSRSAKGSKVRDVARYPSPVEFV